MGKCTKSSLPVANVKCKVYAPKTQCRQCKKLFTAAAMPKHRKTCTKLVDLKQCDICKQFFKGDVGLAIHSRSHTAKKILYDTGSDPACLLGSYRIQCYRLDDEVLPLFKCKKCDKFFPAGAVFESHKLVCYKPEPQVQCHRCLRYYARGGGLYTHTKTCIKSVPKKKCIGCNSMFTVGSGYTMHTRACNKFQLSYAGTSSAP